MHDEKDDDGNAGGQVAIAQSAVCHDTCEPTFDEELLIMGAHLDAKVVFTVCDHDGRLARAEVSSRNDVSRKDLAP